MAIPTSSHWRNADKLAGGRLAEIISDLRSAGLSPEAISRRLFSDHDIEVTRQTIYSWCATLESDGAGVG